MGDDLLRRGNFPVFTVELLLFARLARVFAVAFLFSLTAFFAGLGEGFGQSGKSFDR
jgi:hypothetical protein